MQSPEAVQWFMCLEKRAGQHILLPIQLSAGVIPPFESTKRTLNWAKQDIKWEPEALTVSHTLSWTWEIFLTLGNHKTYLHSVILHFISKGFCPIKWLRTVNRLGVPAANAISWAHAHTHGGWFYFALCLFTCFCLSNKKCMRHHTAQINTQAWVKALTCEVHKNKLLTL